MYTCGRDGNLQLLLEQSGLGEEVELEVQADHIVIRSAMHPRQGWAESFHLMAGRGDDQLLDETLISHSWDEHEWQ